MRLYFPKYFIVLVPIFLIFNSISCAFQKKSTEKSKLNILLLYMDDLRPELGCYGKKHIQSPNIDDFAKTGVMFRNAYSNVPVCGASRASMLTGMRPTRNRFLNFESFVSKETPDAVTLPLLFKRNGYTTISNGKVYHHLDDRTQDWDEVWRPYAFDKNEKGLTPTDYWQSLWKDYHDPLNREAYKKTGNGPAFEWAEVPDSTYIDGLMTQKVIRDLKKLKATKQPFFLTAGFIANHLPFKAPQKYWDMYPLSTIKQPNNITTPQNAPIVSISNWGELRAYNNIPKKGQVSDSLARLLIHGYFASVSYVDALIGEILTTLNALDLDKNTVVILVADHGYHLQENGQWAKFTNYDISSRVPLIVRFPEMQHKGKNSDALLELVDIYPTLADLCGLEIPKNQLDGTSLVPVLKNPTAKGKDHILIKRDNGFTLVTPQYNYTEYIKADDNSTTTSMLYNHRNDPNENINIVKLPEYEAVVKELHTALRTVYKKNIEGNSEQ